MRTTPAAETNQQERPLLIPELTIDCVQLFCDRRRAHWGKVVGPNKDNILYIIRGTIAHHHVRRDNCARIGEVLNSDIHHLIGNHHGANLQETQTHPRPFPEPPLQCDSELDLDVSAYDLLRCAEEGFHEVVHGELVLYEERSKI